MFKNICNLLSMIILATLIFQGRDIREVSLFLAFMGLFMALFALCGKAERAGGLKVF